MRHLICFTLLLAVLISTLDCTRPYKSEPVSILPEIRPQGRFYDFKNAVLNNNPSVIGSMLSSKLFVYTKQDFLKRYELGVILISRMRSDFQYFIYEIESEDNVFEYDIEGELKTGKAFTNFQARRVNRMNPDEFQRKEFLKKLNDPKSPPFEKPEEKKLRIIWILEKNSWQMAFIGSEATNFLDEKSVEKED